MKELSALVGNANPILHPSRNARTAVMLGDGHVDDLGGTDKGRRHGPSSKLTRDLDVNIRGLRWQNYFRAGVASGFAYSASLEASLGVIDRAFRDDNLMRAGIATSTYQLGDYLRSRCGPLI